MNWRGDKSLPVIYIPYLVVAALFLGEVFPVLTEFLNGSFGTPGAKVPIIKSGPDFGIVLIIYTAFGLIFWLLYRYFHWVILVVFAAGLGAILEFLIFKPTEVSGPNVVTNPAQALLFFIIVWPILFTLPYAVFQAVRRKWASRGIMALVLIALAMNILGLGFTYYQMIKTGWFTKYQSDGQSQSETQSKPNKTSYPDLNLITPYVNEADISSINEAYGSAATNPYWGFKHLGIDFMITQNSAPFQAPTEGIITNLNNAKSTGQQGWHSGLCIDHNPFTVCYNFENFTQDDAINQKQQANILVKNGQSVKRGDLIGNLILGGKGTHVDFGIMTTSGGDRVCPESYFTATAKASITRLIAKDHPTWPMCAD